MCLKNEFIKRLDLNSLQISKEEDFYMGITAKTRIEKISQDLSLNVTNYDGELEGNILGFSNFYMHSSCAVCKKKIGDDNFCQKWQKTANGTPSFKVSCLYLCIL
jgi:hypothetical protein